MSDGLLREGWLLLARMEKRAAERRRLREITQVERKLVRRGSDGVASYETRLMPRTTRRTTR